jgi:hypothetical protein
VSITTAITITVTCDKCGSHAERKASGPVPRTVLASARRSLARRDDWQLASRLFGPPQDLCPACQLPEVDPALLVPGMPAAGCAPVHPAGAGRPHSEPSTGEDVTETAVLYVPAGEPGVYEPASPEQDSETTRVLQVTAARR